MTPDEDRARAFAVAAHGDQRYGSDPYVVHLSAVRQVLEDFGYDGDFALAAWLHDTVEDTEVTVVQLEREFGAARGNPRLLAMYREELAGFTAALGDYGDAAMWERLRHALA